MLTELTVRNFVIIDELQLDLRPKLTVLTGETGAGKSIIIDALLLTLGARASADVIRGEAKQADISAVFSIEENPAARAWLEQHDLDPDDTCVLRRVVKQDGKSRGYINGAPCPAQMMRDLGECLVDIHSQHEHHSLLKQTHQQSLLDQFSELGPDLDVLTSHYQHWRTLSQQLAELNAAQAQRTELLERLQFQLREFDELNLQSGDYESITDELNRLSHFQKIHESCLKAQQWLDGSDQSAATELLSKTVSELTPLVDLDPQLAEIRDMLNAAAIQVSESATDLRHYLDALDADPDRTEALNARVAAAQRVALKHAIEPEQIPQHHQRLLEELDAVQNPVETTESITAALSDALANYMAQAEIISEKRRKAATTLQQAITASLHELGMSGAEFLIQLTPNNDDTPTRNGMEKIEFKMSANPGQAAQPIAKAASGGELSRIGLAIQIETMHHGDVPSIIFDEVDVGIGGRVADIVGKKLRGLGDYRQVICITHLAQVAAKGHQHLNISKTQTHDTTQTAIVALDDAARVDEIARMIGGETISEQTRAHAREMLA